MAVDQSFPVNPEVGKIGTNSPTYIQPVAERSDGIKSFFQKQQPSPAKAKTEKRAAVKVEPKKEDKDEKATIETEIEGKDEKDLGDDSNAPNPSPEEKAGTVKEEPDSSIPAKGKSTSTPKRRREDGDNDEEDGKEAVQDVKKGGKRTKVIRHNSDEGSKDVSCALCEMCA